MVAKNPKVRVALARRAVRVRWDQCADPKAQLAPARKGFRARFESQVDPDGTLDPAERTRLADEAQSVYFAELAKRSHVARRLNAEKKAAAA